MKRLLFLAALLFCCTAGAHAAVCTTLAAGSTPAQINSALSSCGSGNTVMLAAGTYTIGSTITLPCGVSLSGPVVPYQQTHYQTAILQETGGITQPIHTTANCSASQSISYLEWNGEQSSGGGGFIYVTPGTQNLTINNNYMHGAGGGLGSYPGCCSETQVMFAGNASSPLTQNDTVAWNEFGPETAGQDCGTAMTATSTSSGGGFCAGWASEGQLLNVTITNNIFHNLEQGMKVAEACSGCGSSPSNGNTQNLVVDYNWFYNIQRIDFETQSNYYDTSHPTSQYIQYNVLGNRNGNNTTGIGTGQQNFDFSIANGCGNPPATNNCIAHMDSNVDVQNIVNTRVGAGNEFWGSGGSTGNYNLVEFNYANAGGAIIWNKDGNFTFNDNTFNIDTTASTGTNCQTGTNSFWNNGNSPVDLPSCTGNTLVNVGSGTYTSNSPTVSPTGRAVPSGTVVSISAQGSNRDANTSAWCTLDGNTPVPGSSGSIMTSFTVTASVTLKCVGQWGAVNQPYSYPAGYGYVPSPVQTNSYMVSGTPQAATPVLTPGGESFTGSVSVTISDGTAGATIYYTLDGSTPTTGSSVYSSAIPVTSTTTVKAIAVASGYLASAQASQQYTLSGSAPPTNPPPVSAYLGTPGSANTMQVGSTLQFSAYCIYGTGVTTSCATPDAYGYAVTSWTTSNAAVMTVGPAGGSNAGLATATGPGTAYIQAQIGSLTSSEWVVTVSGTVATPVMSPSGETFAGTISVAMSDATPGATIYYTVDGSTPTTASSVYISGIAVSATKTIKALAVASGYTNSAVASQTYTLTSSPAPTSAYLGTPGSANTMTTVGTLQFSAYCVYASGTTTNCSTTDTNGYTVTSWTSSNTAVMTIGAVGSAQAGLATATGVGTAYIQAHIGSLASSEWVVTVSPAPTTATPVFSPGTEAFAGSASVAILDSTSGATIYYTLDGSTPTTASTRYSSAVSVTSTTTLKAIAVASGYASSGVASATYTLVTSTVATPVFTPAGESYSGPLSIAITCSTAGATIYYTADGSTPTTGSAQYSSAFSIFATETLKAIAVAAGYTNSAVATQVYTLVPGPAPTNSVRIGGYVTLRGKVTPN